MNIELTDIKFSSKAGEISLASLGFHVENQGLNSIFNLPSYSNINSVDWQEYDGVDVDFYSASLNPVPLSIKIFGEGETAVDALIENLRKLGIEDEILIDVCITEGNFSNKISFSAKWNNATKSKALIQNEWWLDHFMLTDEDSTYITNGLEEILMAGVMKKHYRHLAFVTLNFLRCSNIQYFGLLADNTQACQGIPNKEFVYEDDEDEEKNYPNTNVPLCFKRYSVSNRTATQISVFKLYNSKVYCYPLKGVILGLTGIENSKTAFTIQTENMVGEVCGTKMANKRTSKTISVPLLIRSHSVSAIFQYLGQFKNYIHNTLKGGDMLYLSSKYGDFAVYPTSCNVTKAHVSGMAWVEMTLQFTAYKKGFDFTAGTDNVPEDNPEPPLPPAPPLDFDPYHGITKSGWSVCNVKSQIVGDKTTMDAYFPLPEEKTDKHDDEVTIAQYGWSAFGKWLYRLPVGTCLFMCNNTKPIGGGISQRVYFTLIGLPFFVENTKQTMLGLKLGWTLGSWSKTKFTLVGVVQGCDVLTKNIDNWDSELQSSPDYGGIVGSGSVHVHSDIMTMYNQGLFDVAEGLTITSYTDFDTLVDNMVEMYEQDTLGSGYFTEYGNKLIK